jgi:hypothetical protein
LKKTRKIDTYISESNQHKTRKTAIYYGYGQLMYTPESAQNVPGGCTLSLSCVEIAAPLLILELISCRMSEYPRR